MFSTFVLASLALVLFSLFFSSDFHLVAIAFLLVSIVTLISTFLDPHIYRQLRIIFYVIGGGLLAASIAGFILTELNISVEAYCIVYAIMEIISGGVKVFEGIIILKEKNKMGILFIIDGLIEVALGTQMAIEKEEGLRIHLYLIASDKLYEGIIKLINAFVEDKMLKAEE